MILLADSGSTKCEWLAVDGGQVSRLRTRGINAVLHTPELVREALAELPPGIAPEAVYFYGAGCGEQFPQATEQLTGVLSDCFGTRCVEASSDLLGAARALFGSEEGIACILGTGSNSCWYDGRQVVRNVPPLGYVLGDEGSGSALGRALVNGIFKGHIPLKEEFLEAYSLTYEQIICRVYREPYANRFLASFAPFIRENLTHPAVRAMAERVFGEFVERNLTHYPAGLRVSFVGGVAAHFEELLTEVLQKYGLRAGTIVASPAEGLLRYHYGK